MGRDLGSASGKITLEFDDSGTNEAQRELDDIGDEAVLAAAKAVAALQAIESAADSLGEPLSRMEGMFRDANGRLHDQRGRFVAEGRAAGEGYASELKKRLKKAQAETDNIVKGILGVLGKIGKAAVGAAAISLLAAAVSGLVTSGISLIAALAPLTGLLIGIPAAIGAVVAAAAVLKVALLGVGDALGAALSGDTEKFNEALKKLSPNARQFAKEIKAVAPVLKAVQQQIQDKFFEGLSRQIQPLIDKHLPLLRKFGLGVASDFNSAAQKVAQFAVTGKAVGDVATFLGNVRKSTSALSAAMQPVVRALLDIVTVGSGELPGIANLIAHAATEFAKFIQAARESGALAAFFKTALDLAAQLGTILVNVGRIIGAVFKASGDAGGGLLNTIQQITAGLAQFLNSVEGQDALKSLFSGLAALAGAVVPIIITLAKAIGSNLAPIIQTLATTIGPALNDFLQGLGPALEALAPAAAPFAQAIAGILRAIAPLLPVVGALAAVLLTQLANAFNTLLPVLAPVIKLISGILMTTLTAMQPVLLAVAKAVMPLATAIGGALGNALRALLPAVALLVVSFARSLIPLLPQLTAAMQQLVPPIVKVANEIGKALLAAILALVPHMPALAQATVQIAIAMVQLLVAILPILPSLIRLLTVLLNARGGIQAVIVVLKLIAASINFAAATVRVIVAVLGTLANAARTVGGAINQFRNVVTNAFNQLRTNVQNGIRNAVSVVKAFPGQVVRGMGNLGGLLVGAGASLISGLIRGINNMTGAVLGVARGLASKVASTIKSALHIGSPSKVMIPFGEAIPEGMIVGMNNLAQDLARAALKLADIPPIVISQADQSALLAPASVVSPVRGSDGASMDTVAQARSGGDINVYQQPGESPTELARRLDADRAWRDKR